MAEPISATRAALLGQLAWRPQTAYELTKALSQNVRFLWPSAHSHVYREVRRLAEAGLATSDRGATGRRPRTVYSITDDGREALRVWLGADPGGMALAHEPLLRVLNAWAGTRDDLLRAAERTHADALEILALGDELAQRYLDGTHERQREVHLRVFTFDYLYRWAEFNRDWAERVATEVRKWDDLEISPVKERRALRWIKSVLGASR